MIENPNDWVTDFGDYIVEPKDFYYGSLAIIADNAPDKAIASFRKYIHLVSHAILSWDGFMLKNGIIEQDEENITEWSKIQFPIFKGYVTTNG